LGKTLAFIAKNAHGISCRASDSTYTHDLTPRTCMLNIIDNKVKIDAAGFKSAAINLYKFAIPVILDIIKVSLNGD
jgi:hypothetical protein